MAPILQAGPVSVRYENGFLRYLTLNEAEVVRMIYFAVRDRDWRTARVTFSNELIDQHTDSFRVSYHWQTDDLGIQMAGRVAITGASDGTISFDFQGMALNGFLKNRVGICVLHPLEGVTGQSCQVDTPGGERVESHFPDYISPRQPLLNIQRLHWQLASGHRLQLQFAGEVFEMEDQRNWTDASFKTYSTPLALPFPATMQPGDAVQQRVVFSLESNGPLNRNVAVQAPNAPTEQVATTQLPRIGLGQRADGQTMTEWEAARLRELPLSHLRADVLLTTPDWQSRLTNALTDADMINVPLELALFFGGDPADDLAALLRFIGDNRKGVGSILVFEATTLVTTDALLQVVISPLRLAWPNALIGGGADGSFADFNRNPFDYKQVDFVTYAVTPQVHAFDELTLLENIDGQPPTVRTARHLTGGKPVHISPITLMPRYNTVAQSVGERLSPPIDPRQASDFVADWTRLSLLALTGAGVASVTYYETHGPRGLVDDDTVFPVYAFSAQPATQVS